MLLRVILVPHVGLLPAAGGARQEKNGELPALLLIWSWILSQPHTCLHFRHWEESRSLPESWSHTSVTSKMLLQHHHRFPPFQSNCTKRLYYFASFFVLAALGMEFKALHTLPSALSLSASLLFTYVFKHLYMYVFISFVYVCMYICVYIPWYTCGGQSENLLQKLVLSFYHAATGDWIQVGFRLSSLAISIFTQ